MRKTSGRARLARALGLDRNPLRRASDRAEAWIRMGLLTVFLIAGPIVAIGAGGRAYHTGTATVSIASTSDQAVPARATAPWPALGPSYRYWASQARTGTRQQGTGTSPRTDEVLAVIMTLALMALTLLAGMRLIRAFLCRRRLAAWEMAWSKVGPQWTIGRS